MDGVEAWVEGSRQEGVEVISRGLPDTVQDSGAEMIFMQRNGIVAGILSYCSNAG